VELTTTARVLAEGLLSGPLPRRWDHVQAVAAKASPLSALLEGDEPQILVAAAWLHDVGYAPDLASTGFHALDGARWLRQQGFHERVTSLVAYHSCAVFEAEEHGLADELRSEFSAEESAASDALWYADMTTGPDGQDFSVADGLAEVRSRYGPGHPVTRFWARAEPTLMAAVRRTEERMGG
jgi:putative nucleotidyltransferase with HDIG domain